MISHKHKLIFIHIPRTGGTSFEYLFGYHANKDNYKEKHISASETREIVGHNRWDSYFKFAIVRNPYDRIISAWKRGFYEQSPSEDLYDFLLKYKPAKHENSSFIYSDIIDLPLDYIAKFENIEKEYQFIKDKFNLHLDLPNFEKSKRSKAYQPYYNKKTKAIVTYWYRKDLKKYDYNFNDLDSKTRYNFIQYLFFIIQFNYRKRKVLRKKNKSLSLFTKLTNLNINNFYIKKAIYLNTKGGLSNRLRAINSALILAKKLNQKLIVIWEINHEVGAHFHDLFEALDNVEFLSKKPKIFLINKSNTLFSKFRKKVFAIAPTIRTESVKSFFSQDKNIESLKKYRRILIETEHAFLFSEDYSIFKPKKEINLFVEDKLKNINTDNLIGIHIRRTDHKQAISKSPLHLFVDVIKDELKIDQNFKFFLATDDDEVKQYFIKKFGNTIVTNNFDLSRTTKAGIKNALLDILILSKTKKIYGSFYSSFSETAHYFGSNDLIILKEN
tara:strand:+ start:8306 stop:9805 length:1500 start_codon:yes stop_codon:yes gene_type:complete